MNLRVGKGRQRPRNSAGFFFFSCCNFPLGNCPQVFLTLKSKDQRQKMIGSFSPVWQEVKERCMVGVNKGQCGSGLLPPSVPTLIHDPSWPPTVADLEQVGMPHSTYSLGQKTPLYLVNLRSNSIRLNSYLHQRNSTKPFSVLVQ